MASLRQYECWGRYPKAVQTAQHMEWLHQNPALPSTGKMLPYGLGRSYGDCCLNDGNTIIITQNLNRFISFNEQTGTLRCEAGVSLGEILKVVVPKGWFLAVTPGTKFVTIGGAIANDVHGKNHHRNGTFGTHVRAFELWRSSQERLICSASQNQELFKATIGGLGLTGLIMWAEIQLVRIPTPFLDVEYVKFKGLADFIQLAKSSDKDFEHTVAWVDCSAQGSALGRGVFMRGNYAADTLGTETPKSKAITVPVDAPNWLLNRTTVRMFNEVYFRKHPVFSQKKVFYDGYFYPLDAIENWNRMYGKRGFFQYQFVIPVDQALDATTEILQQVSNAGSASFLSVMKIFGDKAPAGMLSFPKSGITVAMDMANQGAKTLTLLDGLDKVVLKAGGRLYPAKDSRMSAAVFKEFYPNWQEFSKFIDPAFSSSFWRRVIS